MNKSHALFAVALISIMLPTLATADSTVTVDQTRSLQQWLQTGGCSYLDNGDFSCTSVEANEVYDDGMYTFGSIIYSEYSYTATGGRGRGIGCPTNEVGTITFVSGKAKEVLVEATLDPSSPSCFHSEWTYDYTTGEYTSSGWSELVPIVISARVQQPQEETVWSGEGLTKYLSGQTHKTKCQQDQGRSYQQVDLRVNGAALQHSEMGASAQSYRCKNIDKAK